MDNFLEKDMYPPLRNFLEERGFMVFGEVKGCDIVAQSGEETIIIELKRSFRLELIYQAIDRQLTAFDVYIAIPRPKDKNTKQYKNMLRLLKRLGIGLLTVAMDSPLKTVDILLNPSNPSVRKSTKKHKAILTETAGRSVNLNTGGVCRQKIATAYREKSLELCCVLYYLAQAKVSTLRSLGFDANYTRILADNYYNWYYRVKRGIYALTPSGLEALENKDFLVLTTYYKMKWQQILEEVSTEAKD